jgi:hypothetical protein
MSQPSVPEIILAQVWQAGWHARELRTTDGRRVGVVYRGVWTHAAGPDFRDALVELDGRLLRGSIELHVRAADWERHGHASDPAYADVVLHVVLTTGGALPTRHATAGEIATVELAAFLPGPLETFRAAHPVAELGAIGVRTCLPTLAGGREGDVRAVLRREGWRRLAEKQLRFAQALEVLPPAEALYRGLLDGLGLSQNRAGMLAVAEQLPLAALEAIARRGGRRGTLAALLGVAGFVPLSPTFSELAELDHVDTAAIERAFHALADANDLTTLPASTWSLTRVRPGNHPVRRLASLASLVAGAAGDGLLAAFQALPVDDGRSWRTWLTASQPAIGASRAGQIEVNVLAPFLAAYAEANGDAALAERAALAWETLPGTLDDAVAKATLRQIVGERRFPIRLAIEGQGLHQIGRHGCAKLRCFECPIAQLALRYEGDGIA